MAHLPMTRREMDQVGWDELDFLFVSGDAYVDHPAFGCAILTRVLADAGYRVGIIAQPDVTRPDCLTAMGRPRLGVLVSTGVVDSMVNHYTAAGRKRSQDVYSPGGKASCRPDRALLRYGQLVRSQLGGLPLIVGGIEASLRRFAHYDTWSQTVRGSVLPDCAADILVFGEGEQTLLELAGFLARGVPVARLNAIRGTAVWLKAEQLPKKTRLFLEQQGGRTPDFSSRPTEAWQGRCLIEDAAHILLPSAEQVMRDKTAYAVAARYQEMEQDPSAGKILIQPQEDRFLVQNPPARPMDTAALDRVYALPYTRTWHPAYTAQGGVPALQEVRFSVTAHRGCYGGCRFCAITHHMGRIVRSRSDASILAEIDRLAELPDFKGYIHDIGGPTANFHLPACAKQRRGQVCRHRHCLDPEPCPQLETGHSAYLALLRQARQRPGVKKVFVRSGIRFDAVMADPDPSFMLELCQHHISGQLKIAPEHISPAVLRLMGKPSAAVYTAFSERYAAINRQLGLRQYLVPYLISGHPGATLAHAIELALFLRRARRMPEQVQDFYPTPGSLATAMHHTGLDPLSMRPVHVPDAREKRWQRALLQPSAPRNRRLVAEALTAAGRTDLLQYPDGAFAGPAKPAQQAPKGGTDHEHSDQRQGTVRQTARPHRRGR